MRRIRREVSISRISAIVKGGHKGTKVAQLRDVVDVAHTCRTCDLSGILFIPIEFRVNVFRNLGKWIRGIFRPEKVLRIEVIGLLLRRCDRDAIQLHFKTIRNERLVCPAVRKNRYEVDVSVNDEENCRSV